MKGYENLRSLFEPLVRKIGGDVEKEFDELLQRAQTLDAIQPFVLAARNALESVERLPGRKQRATSAPAVVTPTRRGRKKRRRRGEGAKAKAEQDRQRVDIQLALLQAEAKGGPKALARARENCKKLGFSDRQIGSMHAWTHGKFIPQFVGRVHRTYGDQGLKNLSVMYTRLKALPGGASVQALKKLAGTREGKSAKGK